MTQREDIEDFKRHWLKRTLQFLLLVAILFGMLYFAAGAEYKVYTVTAYCACEKCCGKWADGYTANGAKATEGVTCAASRAIPFGTKLEIEGVGVRVVQDRLAKKYDSRIDIYFNSHQKALEFGIKKLKVKVVQ